MLETWQPNIYVFASLSAVVSSFAIAAFVYLRAHEAPTAKPFIFFSVCAGLWCLFPTFSSLPFSNSSILILARASYIPSGLAIASFLHLAFAITSDERTVLRRWCLGVAYSLGALFGLLAFSPWLIVDLIQFAPHFAVIGGPAYHWLVAFYVLADSYGVMIAIRNLQRSSPAKQNQLRYFVLASVILAFSPGLHFAGFYLGSEPFPHDFLVPVFVGLVGYAIVRHHLLDVTVVIKRSLVYSILVACITATYLVAVLVMEKWFQGFFGYRSFVATAVVAFLVAIFFNPLRDLIQTLVDRALFKATPAELAAQREQLLVEIQKSDQMKAVGTLAAGLAHEIKNPLASIKTFTEHLDSRYDDPAFRQKFRKIVGGEVERINLIVQQLLEFAKPVPPKLAPVDIPQLVDETLDFMNSELMAHHVEVQRCYAGRATILADSQQLKQVFLNLVLNSLQAMNGNGRLRVSTAVKGSELELTMADNGSGIAAEDLPKVFEPFFTTKTNGTGLGLAVVQGIMKEHGGRIDVESQLGQGTVVKLRLPIAT